jgi:hypothetical protein
VSCEALLKWAFKSFLFKSFSQLLCCNFSENHLMVSSKKFNFQKAFDFLRCLIFMKELLSFFQSFLIQCKAFSFYSSLNLFNKLLNLKELSKKLLKAHSITLSDHPLTPTNVSTHIISIFYFLRCVWKLSHVFPPPFRRE